MDFEYDPRTERPRALFVESELCFKMRMDGKHAVVVKQNRGAVLSNRMARIYHGFVGKECIFNAHEHYEVGQVVDLR